MNPTNLMHTAPGETLMARLYAHFFQHDSSTSTRVVLIIFLTIFAHVLVNGVGAISERIIAITQQHRDRFKFVSQQPKFVTLLRLVANTFTWSIYFVAMGLFLEECGVNLATYLGSASVIGLAISFGSQGLVQDMVIGLTLIFSDAMDVDDMVEIVGSAVVVGRVQEIGLRFTKVINLYNQVVFIPNRTVANVSRFPHGGIYAYADIQFPAGADREKTTQIIRTIANGMWQQFGAIVLSAPIVDPVRTAQDGGWDFLRIRFVIWPGQGNLIETTFRQQVLRAMKTLDANYADWQITVLYRASGEKIAANPVPPPQSVKIGTAPS
jgi:hypothetical protein